MLFKNSATLAAAFAVLSSVEAKPAALRQRGSRCNGDNLLNRFRNTKYSAAATSFCQTYIHSVSYSVVTVSTDAAHVSSPVTDFPTVYPTPLITTVYPETRLSSACSCLSISQVTAVVTEYVASTTAATTTSTTSSDESVTTTTSDAVTTSTYAASTTTSTSSDESSTTTSDASTTTSDVSTTTSDASTTTSDASTTTSSSDTIGPTAPVSLGCYSEGPRGGRTLTVEHNSEAEQADMTIEKCATLCADFTYYGLEYSGECFCGNTISNGGFKLADQSACNLPCKGDASQTCGGLAALNVYGPPQPDAPLPVVPAFQPVGCYDESGPRVLAKRFLAPTLNTPDLCFLTCTQAGYAFAGLEYGSECWCGDGIAEGSHPAPAEACTANCPGDANTCGGVGAIDVFQAVPT